MDVSASTTAPLTVQPPVLQNRPDTPPASSIGVPSSEDGVSPFLQLLSTPQIHDLLQSIETHRSSQDTAAHSHLQAATSAAADHDVPRALVHLTEFIRLNPQHAAALVTTPALIPIQGDIEGLLRHMTHDAKIGAENVIAGARLVVSSAIARPMAFNGPDVLTVAERFAASGQLLNYIRATELSQAVIASYGPVGVTLPKPMVQRNMVSLLAAWWRRVPLLILLAGWFLLGAMFVVTSLAARAANVRLLSSTIIQSGFEVWGVGFLALAGLQFCISVRGTMRNSRSGNTE
jgi:hypothetical protein